MFLFKIPPEKKGNEGAENELLGLCRFLSLFLAVDEQWKSTKSSWLTFSVRVSVHSELAGTGNARSARRWQG